MNPDRPLLGEGLWAISKGCPEHRFRFGWGHSAPRDPRRSLIGSVAHPDSEEDGHGGVSLDRSRRSDGQ